MWKPSWNAPDCPFRKGGTNAGLFCFQARTGVISALIVLGSEHPASGVQALSRKASEREKSGRGSQIREGWTILTFAREKDGERRPRAEVGGEIEMTGTRVTRRKKRSDSPELGSALRSAYQQTVNEQIPDDLLDLLGKLN
ncbi:MAG TPA: NepR family anti-sigma factor [Allosphingosinicella sp.]|uniref:NepR family anti-sigma factor n=1 Tax=Allosphingosinicella sp. TaxID=2823234 RepID=UPI002F27FE0E